jgi:hypothetical protein
VLQIQSNLTALNNLHSQRQDNDKEQNHAMINLLDVNYKNEDLNCKLDKFPGTSKIIAKTERYKPDYAKLKTKLPHVDSFGKFS